MLFLFFLLFTKHFIVDFILQPAYEYLNKGKYGHPGGVIHAAKHGLVTWLILAWASPCSYELATALAFMDYFLHYHIDYAKVNITGAFNFNARTTQFWWFLGLDQYLHYLTYLAIVWLSFSF